MPPRKRATRASKKKEEDEQVNDVDEVQERMLCDSLRIERSTSNGQYSTKETNKKKVQK
jgi:hypothetical protein